MSKILIPTDFSENSLNQLDNFIQNYEGEGFECVLMFSDFLDDSITDLLFYSQTKFLKEKMPENFEATFEKIKEKYAAKCRISIVPFHGFTTNAFKNFLEGNDISNCFVPKNLEYKMGANPNKFITKSKLTTR
jgi:hypothetical protein